jgi:hypothetical protein
VRRMPARDFTKGQTEQRSAGARDRADAHADRFQGALLTLQRASGNRAVTDLLRHDAGRPLEPATRAEMESKFGKDFGDVRVHTGVEAAATAASQNAKAYTYGTDIVFKGGSYNPVTSGGKRLLAHELAHVVQQSRTSGAQSDRAETTSLESSAEQAAMQSQSSAQVGITGGASPGIARSPEDDDLLKQLDTPGVEMPWVGKGPGINSSELGYLRDPDKFWKAFAAEHGGTPEELRLLRETSDHHHIGKGGKAVPLSKQVHRESSGDLHPTEGPVEQTGEITPASELAGGRTASGRSSDSRVEGKRSKGRRTNPRGNCRTAKNRSDETQCAQEAT